MHLIVEHLCRKYKIRNYTINHDMTIDVDGNVNLCYLDLESIPLIFGKVSGYFTCARNNLTSLEHCPTYIGGVFDCLNNNFVRRIFIADFYIGGYLYSNNLWKF